MSATARELKQPARRGNAAAPPPVVVAGVGTGETHRIRVATKRGGSDAFFQLVQGEPVAGLAAIELIRGGFAATMLKAASRYFDVPDARIQQIARVPASTASRLEKKQARIDSGATERIFRLGNVTRMALDVLESETAAVDWMRQPNRALGDVAPLEMMDTEPGAVSVRQVLNAIATGGAA